MAVLIVMTAKLMKHSMNIIGNVMIRCVLKHFVRLSAMGITDALHHDWTLIESNPTHCCTWATKRLMEIVSVIPIVFAIFLLHIYIKTK